MPFQKGYTPWNKGKENTSVYKENMRQIMLGRKLTPEWKAKIGEAHKGSKCPFWKGGITPINHTIKMTAIYKNWRTSVFVRDKYTCIICGKIGTRLNADHIKPFADFPELRFDINNGRTLCVECHRKTDTYGSRTRWRQYNVT